MIVGFCQDGGATIAGFCEGGGARAPAGGGGGGRSPGGGGGGGGTCTGCDIICRPLHLRLPYATQRIDPPADRQARPAPVPRGQAARDRVRPLGGAHTV